MNFRHDLALERPKMAATVSAFVGGFEFESLPWIPGLSEDILLVVLRPQVGTADSCPPPAWRTQLRRASVQPPTYRIITEEVDVLRNILGPAVDLRIEMLRFRLG